MFSNLPFATFRYISSFESTIPLSFLISVSAMRLRLPSESILPLLFSIIPASTWTFFPDISPVAPLYTLPLAFMRTVPPERIFPSFMIFNELIERPSSPLIFITLFRTDEPVSNVSTLAVISSFRFTPCFPTRVNASLLSIFPLTVTVPAFIIVEASPATSPSYV